MIKIIQELNLQHRDNITNLYHITIGHDDVIKWKHFPRNWPFVRGIHRSSVNSPHKGRWRGTLMFSLIYAWNKRLGKQSTRLLFETPSRPLWRHCNRNYIGCKHVAFHEEYRRIRYSIWIGIISLTAMIMHCGLFNCTTILFKEIMICKHQITLELYKMEMALNVHIYTG